MGKFKDLITAAEQDITSGITSDTVADEARWDLDGHAVTATPLGRDWGFDIICRDPAGKIEAYVCVDGGPEAAADALDDIEDAVQKGITDPAAIFGMWDNGLGGMAFDPEYFPED